LKSNLNSEDKLKYTDYYHNPKKEIKQTIMTNKQILENFKQSEDNKLVNIYLSGVYLLLSVQQDWWDSAEELMLKHGVMNYEFKQKFNRVKKGLNGFEIQLRDMMLTKEKKTEMLEDYEEVSKALTKYIMGNYYQEPEKKLVK
jgi:hypothetical protein